MRNLLVVVSLLLCPLTSALAQISIQLDLPSVSIGISEPEYPLLVLVPGYPVYYDPAGDSNYFFYDGMYWVFQGDSWYASSWYDGPWALVEPEGVPLFVLRVPVSYYRRPPSYFQGWRADASPRWGEHWGDAWDRQHRGWDSWDRRGAPAPAPLPVYQRAYSGSRYPQVEEQQALRGQNDRHEPSDAAVRRVFQAQAQHRGPAQTQPGNAQHAQPAAPAQYPPPGANEHAQPGNAQHAQPAAPAQHAPPGANEHAQHAQPAQRAPPVASAEHAQPAAPAPHAQPAHAPQPDRGPAGQGGAADPRRAPAQPRGEERNQERER